MVPSTIEIAPLPFALARAEAMSTPCALKVPLRAVPFAHDGWHRLPTGQTLASSFHTSRYNVNTGRLTEAMFDGVVARLAGAMTASAVSLTR